MRRLLHQAAANGLGVVLVLLTLGVWTAWAQQDQSQPNQSGPAQSGPAQSGQAQSGQARSEQAQQQADEPIHVRIIDGQTYIRDGSGLSDEVESGQARPGQPRPGQAMGGGPTDESAPAEPAQTAARQCPDVAIMEQRQQALDERAANLNAREQALDRRAAALQAQKDALDRRAAALDRQASALSGQ